MAVLFFQLREGNFGEYQKLYDTEVKEASTVAGFARIRCKLTGLKRDRAAERRIDGRIQDQMGGEVVVLSDPETKEQQEIYLVYD